MISMVTLLKGLKHIGLDLTLGMGSAFADAMVISAVIGLIVAAIGALILGKITPRVISTATQISNACSAFL